MFDLVAVVELADLRLAALSRSGHALLHLRPDLPPDDVDWRAHFTEKTWKIIRSRGVATVSMGRVWRGQGMLRSVEGGEIPVRLVFAPATGERAVLAAIDDSAGHTMQTVLRHEQMLLHAVLNTVPDSIYFKDRESRFVRTNPAHARRMGVSGPEELLGRTDADFYSPDHAQRARADEARVMATGEPLLDSEEKETWPDGRVTWVATSKFPLRGLTGEIIGTFGISRDITTRKLAEEHRREAEAQLIVAQKMEMIGRLAAGVAHEINTPTQFINDNVHFLVNAFRELTRVLEAHRRLREAAAAVPALAGAAAEVRTLEAASEVDYLLAEIPGTLEQSLDGLDRVARIVYSLREFSHPNAPEKRPADLNHAIETAVSVSRHEWKLVADVVTELDRDLPLVPCVLDEINQVILNLIVNAAHAIQEAIDQGGPARGTITLRTRREPEHVLIEVADTGTGIPESARDLVFEPFFTTKPLGRGTGQGLAFVHTMIVKDHQGAIDFTTETGRGTTFRIRLPLRHADVPPADVDANFIPPELLAP